MTHVFTLGDLASFVNAIKPFDNYTIVSLDQILPSKKTHEDYETAVKEPGFFDSYVKDSPDVVHLVINPAESSGITLVFVHELLVAGKEVHVHVVGRWKKNPLQNRFIFRLVFGILHEKALIEENLFLHIFPQDVYAMSYKGSVVEENSEMLKVFGTIFHAKNVFTSSQDKVQLSGDFVGDYDTFQHFSRNSKVSCLAKASPEQVTVFQSELKKMMDMCDLKCTVIRRDFFYSGEEMTNDKAERFLNETPQIINNMKLYSLGKQAALFEIYFI